MSLTDESDENEVVASGDEPTTIVWWARYSSPVGSFAAKELQSYLSEITGTAPPILPGEDDETLPENISSLVGIVPESVTESTDPVTTDTTLEPELVNDVNSSLDERPSDSFSIQTGENTIVCGGTSDRGTLYAVYTLLEELGVRFFAPDFPFYDGHHEHIPDRDEAIVPPLDVVEVPDFVYRRRYAEACWSHTEQTLIALIDWMAKTRHNVFLIPTDFQTWGFNKWDMWRDELIPELDSRGLMVETGNHGFNTFLKNDKYEPIDLDPIDDISPRLEDPFDDESFSVPEELIDTHPDWFVDGYNVFDVSNDKALETYVENVIAYLDSRPEIDIFDAWPTDGARWPPALSDEFGSVTDAYTQVINQLSEAVETAFPDREITIESIAYYSHINAPNEQVVNERAIVDFATYDRSYAVPLSDPGAEQNQKYVDTLNDWKRSFDGTLGVYEYFRKQRWHSLPVILPDIIEEDFRFYHSNGVRAMTSAYPVAADWITYELTHLLISAMSWNVELYVTEYVEDYLDARYGTAAEQMNEYLNHVQTAGKALFDSVQGTYDDLDFVSLAREEYLEAQKSLSAAAHATDDATAGFMIDRLSENIEFAIADTEISYYELTNEPQRAAYAKQRTAGLIRKHRFDGILLESFWTYDRCRIIDVPREVTVPFWVSRYRRYWS